MSKLITCIWFVKNDADEAVKYYIDTFNSAPGEHTAKLGDITKSPKESEEVSGRPEGSVMTVECELDGISFMFLNGGPFGEYKLNGATSYIVECETQEEIDFFESILSLLNTVELLPHRNYLEQRIGGLKEHLRATIKREFAGDY